MAVALNYNTVPFSTFTGAATLSRLLTTTVSNCLCIVSVTYDNDVQGGCAGAGLTWNLLRKGAHNAVWWAWATNPITTQTVTVTFGVGVNTSATISIRAWSGAKNAAPGLSVVINGNNNMSFTPLVTGSQLECIGHQNSNVASTFQANNTDLNSLVVPGGPPWKSFGTYYNTLTTVGVAQTLGLTSAISSSMEMWVMEVYDSAGTIPSQSYDRVWNFLNNQAYTPASALDLLRYTAWFIGAVLLGNSNAGSIASGNWTLVTSCNSLVSNSSDNLHLTGAGAYTAGDWVRAAAGVAHSYYVLKSPVMNGQQFHLLVSLGTNSDAIINLSMSRLVFSGGTTTADPTSTEAWNMNNTLGTGLTYVAGAHRFSACLSTTGDFIVNVFKTASSALNTGPFCMAVLAPVGVHPDDGWAVWSYAYTSSFNAQVMTNIAQAPSRLAWGIAGGNMLPYPNAAGFNALTATDYLSNTVPDFPCWLMTSIDSSSSGPWHARGRLPDCMWQGGGYAGGGHLPPGKTVKDGGAVIRYQTLGAIIIPASAAWDFT